MTIATIQEASHLTASASHLIPPHGGELVQLLAQPDRIAELKAHSKDWPSWDLSARQLCDLELLLSGGFSPLSGFMTRADFESQWDGRVVLMARRARLSDLSRRFDITWFLGAVYKYRQLFGEVLVASFFLQIFGLVTPLFFQVIIDKVLVHRSMNTLHVLVIGLAAVSIFEAIIGGLRNLDVTEDAMALTQAIMAAGILPPKVVRDAAHVAVAAVHL